MSTRVRDSFRAQAVACETLGSPFTGRILRLLADGLAADNEVAKQVLNWAGDPSGRVDALGLRLAGGLHALVLGGEDDALQAAYRAMPNQSDARLLAVLTGAMARHEAFLLDWLRSAPQTNEVRRSAVLIAAGHWLAARFGLPLVLSELGASAGLNLIWDRYALKIGGQKFGPDDPVLVLSPEWRGDLPPANPPLVAARAGVDLNPLDPNADRLRLMAYIWADQKERLERTDIATQEAGRLRLALTRADAVDWLERRLGEAMPGRLHLIYHTVAWQYFPAPAQTRGTALLEAAGTRATRDAPLAHLSMESDGEEPGAALSLRLWPGDITVQLGRADFHGRWVDWQAPQP